MSECDLSLHRTPLYCNMVQWCMLHTISQPRSSRSHALHVLISSLPYHSLFRSLALHRVDNDSVIWRYVDIEKKEYVVQGYLGAKVVKHYFPSLHQCMDVSLDAAVWLWKPSNWSWADLKVWRSAVTHSAESWRPLCSVPHHLLILPCQWPWPLTLWRRYCHLQLLPLTLDSGIFSCLEMSWLSLFYRWYLEAVPWWNSQKS